MSNERTHEYESSDIEPRTRRALERVASVLHTDGTPIAADESPTVVSVFSGNSGTEHRVDVAEQKCTCRDHRHRETRCYHIRRAQMILGVEPVDTETLAACDVHQRFAEHCPGPVVATSDGGLVGRETDEETADTATHQYTHIAETRRECGETHGYSSPPPRDGPTNPDL